eukprot:CAMPEP_0119159412 /NCGR_PEP_ID=MMETSP1310-20130426/53748_1 /TAXON_ID=464262 /ORGANISM="Genus nov. species nov., Strain RCC2339" /LENGTH=191 /DNA_ID=CAMNT_0007152041 /DNA_START=793 /DNA_END=1373 /DNA_ORIENTATION=-
MSVTEILVATTLAPRWTPSKTYIAAMGSQPAGHAALCSIRNQFCAPRHPPGEKLMDRPLQTMSTTSSLFEETGVVASLLATCWGRDGERGGGERERGGGGGSQADAGVADRLQRESFVSGCVPTRMDALEAYMDALSIDDGDTTLHNAIRHVSGLLRRQVARDQDEEAAGGGEACEEEAGGSVIDLTDAVF